MVIILLLRNIERYLLNIHYQIDCSLKYQYWPQNSDIP